jgi:hypothetical protein
MHRLQEMPLPAILPQPTKGRESVAVVAVAVIAAVVVVAVNDAVVAPHDRSARVQNLIRRSLAFAG